MLGTSAARAEDRVIVLSLDPAPTPSAARTADQLEHELAAEGFSVIRAREDDAARRLRAERGWARVHINGDPSTGATADVWISGRDGGRRFRERTDPEGRTLSLRVLEYVRASLIELEPPAPAEAASEPAAFETVVADEAGRRREAETVAVFASVGAFTQLEDVPARFGGALGARYRLLPRLYAEARVARGAASTIVHRNERATVTETWATLGARLFVVEEARLSAFLGAGLGAYHASTSGHTHPPRKGQSDGAFLPLVMLGVGATVQVLEFANATLAISARADAALTSGDVTVRFAEEVVSHYGRLFLFPNAGAEVSW